MNPVLRKDLLGLLRLKRVAAVQIFFVAVLGILVLATWPQSGLLSLVKTDDRLLVGLVVGQIALLALFVPGIAGVALTTEKEQNTLEMLYASRLSPAQIIFGKIGLAVSYPIILLLSGVPFVALLSWRGDVLAHDLGWSYIILGLTAVYLSMISLMISALCRQSATALVFSYVTVLVLCGVVMVPHLIMGQQQAGAAAGFLHYIRSVSPIGAALSVLHREQMLNTETSSQMAPLWEAFLWAAGILIVLSFAVVAAKLSRAPSTQEGFGAPAGGNDMQRSLGRKLMFLIDPKKKRKPMNSFNPLLGKERRTNNLRSGRWMIRIFYGALFASLGLSTMSLYGGTEHTDLLLYVMQILVALQIGIVALIDPSLTSSAISSEIENGTFETLRLTPLSGSKIFWGKFLPSFFPALLPVLALIPAYAALCFIGPSYWPRIARLMPVVVLAVAFCCALGLTASSFVSQTARATVVAYLVTAAWFVLPLFAWWASGEQLSEHTATMIGFISPLVMALNLLPNASPGIYNMYSAHLWLMGGVCIALVIIARVRLAVLLKQG